MYDDIYCIAERLCLVARNNAIALLDNVVIMYGSNESHYIVKDGDNILFDGNSSQVVNYVESHNLHVRP